MTRCPHHVAVLITPESEWPLPGPGRMRRYWSSWGAWWSGDLDWLKRDTPATSPGGYWERRAQKLGGRDMHLPIASDVARTSAKLLFGDAPRLEFAGDGVQDVWDELAEELGWSNSLLEGAEVGAAMGGVFLRPQWDASLAKRPLLTMVRADEAIPQFTYGMLRSVTFFTEYDESGGTVLRWLEHHEPGQIRHELWRGNSTNIGRSVPLTEHPDTAGLVATLGPDGVVDTTPIRPDGGLLVDYVPNDLPQPLHRQPYGKADVQGLETELDALDESWDSWMRDIRLGKSRILASQEVLDEVVPTKPGLLGKWRKNQPTKVLDTDAEVFMSLPGMPMDEGGKLAPITPVQFKIRFQEHAETCNALVDEIVSRAGYAPQSFGRHVEGQLSGTAISRRERRSSETRNKKRKYWKPAIQRQAETLMLINYAVFSGPTPGDRPALEWPADQADPKESAETVELLRRAEAISTETAVQMAHPEWPEGDVTEEVGRIIKERPAAPDPTGFETPDQLDEGAR